MGMIGGPRDDGTVVLLCIPVHTGVTCLAIVHDYQILYSDYCGLAAYVTAHITVKLEVIRSYSIVLDQE